MFLCLLRHERYEENVSFTRLNNFANGSKKNRLAVYISTDFVSFFRLTII